MQLISPFGWVMIALFAAAICVGLFGFIGFYIGEFAQWVRGKWWHLTNYIEHKIALAKINRKKRKNQW